MATCLVDHGYLIGIVQQLGDLLKLMADGGTEEGMSLNVLD